ncbi:glycosyltransferase family A protein [Candidatus Spongiihabitans sp.]|uniref:glycosyltransferase family A protein n=1 Tax=Candidatus Spongiihabitans sp. TaxID=3101308 RepID=UPI003C7CBB71
MKFSKTSDVTVVLTSCGRFDLLAQTLITFFENNTYPISQFILIEDSGKAEVSDFIPAEYRERIDLIINQPQIGQVSAIDTAYRLVKTDYIFHCEDDWLFYRPGFIEDSKTVLEAEPQSLMVHLRSYHHDLAFYGARAWVLAERKTVQNIAYYRVNTTLSHSQCFSFNPGLRRRAQYPDGGYASLVAKGQSPADMEMIASEHYAAQGYFAVLLENDAVKHTGFGKHVRNYDTRWTKYRGRLLRLVVAIAMFALGWYFGAAK